MPSAKATTESYPGGERQGLQGTVMSPIWESLQGQKGRGSNVFITTNDNSVNNAASRVQMQKPYDNITAGEGFRGEHEQTQGMMKQATEGGGGSEVLGAVGETVAEIGGTIMKPAEKVQQGKGGGGVFGAIGETVAEIAETTKVMVVGDGEIEPRQGTGSQYKHE